DHHQVAGSRKITTEGDVSHRIAGSQHIQTGDATVIDSGQEIHLKSGGKVVLEPAAMWKEVRRRSLGAKGVEI
ncbi:hypothetical protein, partial [Xenorhabdus bovienii]|uniref:hypothetical protein n=1 Tax=Xenorhabdus bovienii TaxID=40576 RepID=UPI00237CCF28